MGILPRRRFFLKDYSGRMGQWKAGQTMPRHWLQNQTLYRSLRRQGYIGTFKELVDVEPQQEVYNPDGHYSRDELLSLGKAYYNEFKAPHRALYKRYGGVVPE